MASIMFLGGTDTVTGSKFLVRSGDRSVLVDCGIFQGPRDVKALNWEDPFFTRELPDEVLLTHAHIDHTGFLPRLVGLRHGEVVFDRRTSELDDDHFHDLYDLAPEEMLGDGG